MKSEEIIKILKDDRDNIDFEWLKEEAQPIFDAYSEAIKAVEIIEKIKNVYANAYKCLLGNIENGFTEEMATPVFYHDIAFSINNILSDAYDTDDKIWIKEIIDE